MTIYASKAKATATTKSYGSASISLTVEEGTRTVGAGWKWNHAHTDYCTVRWDYRNADGRWVLGTSSTHSGGKSTSSSTIRETYTAPDDAISVRFYILPVSTSRTLTYYTNKKKTKTNTVTVKYWTATSATKAKAVDAVLDAPSVGSVEYQATGARMAVEIGVTSYKYELYRYVNGVWSDPETNAGVVGKYAADTLLAYDTEIIDGCSYAYAARPYTTYGSTTVRGDFGDISSPVAAPPAAPGLLIPQAVASSSGLGFTATWKRRSYEYNGETYELRWAQAQSDLAIDGAYESADVEEQTYSYSGEVDEAGTWFFAVLAVTDAGSSDLWYSDSILIGATPSAPTMGSVPTYVEEGDTVYISWTFNSRDGSEQTAWLLEVSTDSGETWETEGGAEDTATSYSYTASETGTVRFRCSTAGATGEFSETAQTADVTVIERMSLTVTSEDTYTGFPITFELAANLEIRQWALNVRTEEALAVTSGDGDEEIIPANALVYSLVLNSGDEGFDSTSVTVSADATDAEIHSGGTYTFTAGAVSVYGTTGEYSGEFSASWNGEEPQPEMAGVFDDEALECHLFPICPTELTSTLDGDVTLSYATYTDDDGEETAVMELSVGEDYVFTFDGSVGTPSLLSALADGVEFSESDSETAYELLESYLEGFEASTTAGDLLDGDTLLDVYRSDPNGERVLIAGEVPNTGSVEIIDSYPCLNGASYRVRATTATGVVGFYDCDVETECNEIVIQFDDQGRSYSGEDEDALDYDGFVELPYNVEISETYEPDVSLVEYIGNAEPTLYTGTQRGASVSASSSVVRSIDPDAIAKLRRYAGAVTRAWYRDPTGLSFRAFIEVSLSTSHSSAATEASLKVTRVLDDYGATVTTGVEG